nr:reverse transcriptase domain-containing protein [Tanacetum cinerariifolium]
MRTRSSSNPVGESSPNLTTSNPKRHNRRHSKQPFILKESPVDTMADRRTMAELLRAPTEGYAEAIVVPPILAENFELMHSLINMMTLDQFFRLEKDNPHDHICWFNKITSTIKYKEAWDRYKDLLRACPHYGFTELHQLDTFYNALIPADQDSLNSTAGGNLLERRTQDVLTIIEHKSKVRNSQNKLIVSQVKSSDANSYSSSEIAKLTHAVNQQTSVVTTVMTAILKQFQAISPPASVKSVEEICVTCGSAHQYYQCLANDGNTFPEFRDNIQAYVSAAAINYNQGESKSITTQSGHVLDGPSVLMPPPFINLKEDERVEETLMDPNLAEYTIKVPPPLQDKDEIQIHKFWQMFKQLHINITLADALILILKYQKMLKALLSNKEKLLELANTPLNENCTAVILKKLPEKLGDHGKFLIPCGFSKLKCKALADLGASINLMPLSVWEKLGLPELISTRKTIELANRAICTPAGIARDVFVPVGKFAFPADFVNVDYESAPRVSLIEIKYLLNHDPTKEMDSILEDLVDEDNLADPNNNLFDAILEMFTDKDTLDYSSPPLYDDFDNDLDKLESKTDDIYDDPFDSKEDKIKEPKLLIDELDPLRSSDFLPSLEYDSFLFEDFSEVDALPLTDNEDKVFNPVILIRENLSEVTTQVTPDKNVKKISISNTSLILEDFILLFLIMNFLSTKKFPGSKLYSCFHSKMSKKFSTPGFSLLKEFILLFS